MARQSGEKTNKQAVSPINGQPVPDNRKYRFTSETARAARDKRTAKEAAKKSITAAFMCYMCEVVVVEKDGTPLTGAQAIAKSIIRGAAKGNAEMVKIALAIAGETPSAKVEISNGHLLDLINGLKEPEEDDLHTETAGADETMADK